MGKLVTSISDPKLSIEEKQLSHSAIASLTELLKETGEHLVGAGLWIYNELQNQSSKERERWRSKYNEL